MWLVSTCQRDRSPLTEFLQRTTHTNPYILDRTPVETTLCTEAATLLHWMWITMDWSLLLTIQYPAEEIFFLIWATNLLRSWSLRSGSIEVLINVTVRFHGKPKLFNSFGTVTCPKVLECSIQKIPWNQDQLVFLWEIFSFSIQLAWKCTE